MPFWGGWISCIFCKNADALCDSVSQFCPSSLSTLPRLIPDIPAIPIKHDVKVELEPDYINVNIPEPDDYVNVNNNTGT